MEVDIAEDLMLRIRECRRFRKRSFRFSADRVTRLEDFPFCDVPILSDRAREALSEPLANDGEFIQAELWKGKVAIKTRYWLYNCLRLLDVVDRKRTPRILFEPSGLLKPGGTAHHKFERVPKEINAFRFCESPGGLIVSDALAMKIQDAGLSGWMLAPMTMDRDGRRTILSDVFPRR